jgi:hypothetical protein
MRELKKYFDNFGDMPKLPPRKIEDADTRTQKLADIANILRGIEIDDLKNGIGDWKFDSELSAGINKVFIIRNALTGERVLVKHDDDYLVKGRGQVKYYGNGARAEEMVAALYRDLGFAQPAFVAVNPGDPNPDLGGVGVMEYADAGFFGLVDIKIHNKGNIRNISDVSENNKEEILNFLVANAIIGNTDRHGGNFMWGIDPATGKARIIPIDNGLAIFNGGFNSAEDNENNPLYLDPIKVLTGSAGGKGGSFSRVGAFAKGWVQEIGEDAARNQVLEFAERMRDRAKAMKFIDPRANAYLEARAQYIIDDPQKIINAVLRFW